MYLKDYKVGMEYKLEPISFSKEEIIDFAKKYDPRPIHIDEEAGKNSRFKGIISSGMMTLVLCWGKWVHTKIDEGGLIAGIGFDKVRWLNPVYPDMNLYGLIRVVEIKENSNGVNGKVRSELIVRDEEGKDIMYVDALTLVAKSPEIM